MAEWDANPEEWEEVFSPAWGDDDEDDLFEPPQDDDENRPVEIDDEQVVAVRMIDHEASEIRRGKRLLAKPHGSLSGPDGDPSPKEIRLMTAAIRSDWSGADLRRARCRQSDPVEMRTVKVGG